jgi:hypothetical protein
VSARGIEGVSVILPVLDEHDNLEPLHARLTMAIKPLGRDYEIVYVDDGRRQRCPRDWPTPAIRSSSRWTRTSRTIPPISRACWKRSTAATTSCAAGAAGATIRG